MLRIAVVLLLPMTACFSPEVCDGDEAPQPSPSLARGDAGFLPYGHAHNDYEQARPLEDAIAAGLHSVEADVWFRDQQVVVSHDAFSTKGRLDELYLNPIGERMAANNGNVTADGLPFTLWIDLKEGSDELVGAIYALLDGRAGLSTYGQVTTAAAMTVVLTGDQGGKEKLSRFGDGIRPYTRDSNEFSLVEQEDAIDGSHPTRYALDYGRYLGWNGDGDVDAEQKRRLGCLITHAHRDGRQVRFYNVPEQPSVWQFLLDGGVDLIGADDLDALGGFLRGLTQ
jgi:glycerophosphoryl diester phosphodiesterase